MERARFISDIFPDSGPTTGGSFVRLRSRLVRPGDALSVLFVIADARFNVPTASEDEAVTFRTPDVTELGWGEVLADVSLVRGDAVVGRCMKRFRFHPPLDVADVLPRALIPACGRDVVVGIANVDFAAWHTPTAAVEGVRGEWLCTSLCPAVRLEADPSEAIDSAAASTAEPWCVELDALPCSLATAGLHPASHAARAPGELATVHRRPSAATEDAQCFLRFQVPPALPPGRYRVRPAANGRDFIPAKAAPLLHILASSHLRCVWPPCRAAGEVAAVSLYGSGFSRRGTFVACLQPAETEEGARARPWSGELVQCRHRSGNRVSCVLPSTLAPSVCRLQLSFNDGYHWLPHDEGGEERDPASPLTSTNLTLTLNAPVRPLHVHPLSGPAHGGTEVVCQLQTADVGAHNGSTTALPGPAACWRGARVMLWLPARRRETAGGEEDEEDEELGDAIPVFDASDLDARPQPAPYKAGAGRTRCRRFLRAFRGERGQTTGEGQSGPPQLRYRCRVYSGEARRAGEEARRLRMRGSTANAAEGQLPESGRGRGRSSSPKGGHSPSRTPALDAAERRQRRTVSRWQTSFRHHLSSQAVMGELAPEQQSASEDEDEDEDEEGALRGVVAAAWRLALLPGSITDNEDVVTEQQEEAEGWGAQLLAKFEPLCPERGATVLGVVPARVDAVHGSLHLRTPPHWLLCGSGGTDTERVCVSVALDGRTFHGALSFRAYDMPLLCSATPSCVSAHGGTSLRVRVTGVHLRLEAPCVRLAASAEGEEGGGEDRLLVSKAAPATVLGINPAGHDVPPTTDLSVTSPAWPHAATLTRARLEVAFNGVNMSSVLFRQGMASGELPPGLPRLWVAIDPTMPAGALGNPVTTALATSRAAAAFAAGAGRRRGAGKGPAAASAPVDPAIAEEFARDAVLRGAWPPCARVLGGTRIVLRGHALPHPGRCAQLWVRWRPHSAGTEGAGAASPESTTEVTVPATPTAGGIALTSPALPHGGVWGLSASVDGALFTVRTARVEVYEEGAHTIQHVSPRVCPLQPSQQLQVTLGAPLHDASGWRMRLCAPKGGARDALRTAARRALALSAVDRLTGASRRAAEPVAPALSALAESKAGDAGQAATRSGAALPSWQQVALDQAETEAGAGSSAGAVAETGGQALPTSPLPPSPRGKGASLWSSPGSAPSRPHERVDLPSRLISGRGAVFLLPGPLDVPGLAPLLAGVVRHRSLVLEVAPDGQHFAPAGNLAAGVSFRHPPCLARCDPPAVLARERSPVTLHAAEETPFPDAPGLRAYFVYPRAPREGDAPSLTQREEGAESERESVIVSVTCRRLSHVEVECETPCCPAEVIEAHGEFSSVTARVSVAFGRDARLRKELACPLQVTPPPRVDALFPGASLVGERSLVVVTGRGFLRGHPLRVRFGAAGVVRPQWVSDRHLLCRCPPLPREETVQVSVETGAGDAAGARAGERPAPSVPFPVVRCIRPHTYALSSASDPRLASAGGSTLRIRGGEFPRVTDAWVRIVAAVPAAAASALACTAADAAHLAALDRSRGARLGAVCAEDATTSARVAALAGGTGIARSEAAAHWAVAKRRQQRTIGLPRADGLVAWLPVDVGREERAAAAAEAAAAAGYAGAMDTGNEATPVARALGRVDAVGGGEGRSGAGWEAERVPHPVAVSSPAVAALLEEGGTPEADTVPSAAARTQDGGHSALDSPESDVVVMAATARGRVVGGNVVTCQTPPFGLAVWVAVHVSFDGQHFVPVGGKQEVFRAPALHALHPSSCPLGRACAVEARGENMRALPDHTLRLALRRVSDGKWAEVELNEEEDGATRSSSGHGGSSSSLRFTTPESLFARPSSLQLELSVDSGQTYVPLSAPLLRLFREPRALELESPATVGFEQAGRMRSCPLVIRAPGLAHGEPAWLRATAGDASLTARIRVGKDSRIMVPVPPLHMCASRERLLALTRAPWRREALALPAPAGPPRGQDADAEQLFASAGVEECALALGRARGRPLHRAVGRLWAQAEAMRTRLVASCVGSEPVSAPADNAQPTSPAPTRRRAEGGSSEGGDWLGHPLHTLWPEQWVSVAPTACEAPVDVRVDISMNGEAFAPVPTSFRLAPLPRVERASPASWPAGVPLTMVVGGSSLEPGDAAVQLVPTGRGDAVAATEVGAVPGGALLSCPPLPAGEYTLRPARGAVLRVPRPLSLHVEGAAFRLVGAVVPPTAAVDVVVEPGPALWRYLPPLQGFAHEFRMRFVPLEFLRRCLDAAQTGPSADSGPDELLHALVTAGCIPASADGASKRRKRTMRRAGAAARPGARGRGTGANAPLRSVSSVARPPLPHAVSCPCDIVRPEEDVAWSVPWRLHCRAPSAAALGLASSQSHLVRVAVEVRLPGEPNPDSSGEADSAPAAAGGDDVVACSEAQASLAELAPGSQSPRRRRGSTARGNQRDREAEAVLRAAGGAGGKGGTSPRDQRPEPTGPAAVVVGGADLLMHGLPDAGALPSSVLTAGDVASIRVPAPSPPVEQVLVRATVEDAEETTVEAWRADEGEKVAEGSDAGEPNTSVWSFRVPAIPCAHPAQRASLSVSLDGGASFHAVGEVWLVQECGCTGVEPSPLLLWPDGPGVPLLLRGGPFPSPTTGLSPRVKLEGPDAGQCAEATASVGSGGERLSVSLPTAVTPEWRMLRISLSFDGGHHWQRPCAWVRLTAPPAVKAGQLPAIVAHAETRLRVPVTAFPWLGARAGFLRACVPVAESGGGNGRPSPPPSRGKETSPPPPLHASAARSAWGLPNTTSAGYAAVVPSTGVGGGGSAGEAVAPSLPVPSLPTVTRDNPGPVPAHDAPRRPKPRQALRRSVSMRTPSPTRAQSQPRSRQGQDWPPTPASEEGQAIVVPAVCQTPGAAAAGGEGEGDVSWSELVSDLPRVDSEEEEEDAPAGDSGDADPCLPWVEQRGRTELRRIAAAVWRCALHLQQRSARRAATAAAAQGVATAPQSAADDAATGEDPVDLASLEGSGHDETLACAAALEAAGVHWPQWQDAAYAVARGAAVAPALEGIRAAAAARAAAVQEETAAWRGSMAPSPPTAASVEARLPPLPEGHIRVAASPNGVQFGQGAWVRVVDPRKWRIFGGSEQQTATRGRQTEVRIRVRGVAETGTLAVAAVRREDGAPTPVHAPAVKAAHARLLRSGGTEEASEGCWLLPARLCTEGAGWVCAHVPPSLAPGDYALHLCACPGAITSTAADLRVVDEPHGFVLSPRCVARGAAMALRIARGPGGAGLPTSLCRAYVRLRRRASALGSQFAGGGTRVEWTTVGRGGRVQPTSPTAPAHRPRTQPRLPTQGSGQEARSPGATLSRPASQHAGSAHSWRALSRDAGGGSSSRQGRSSSHLSLTGAASRARPRTEGGGKEEMSIMSAPLGSVRLTVRGGEAVEVMAMVAPDRAGGVRCALPGVGLRAAAQYEVSVSADGQNYAYAGTLASWWPVPQALPTPALSVPGHWTPLLVPVMGRVDAAAEEAAAAAAAPSRAAAVAAATSAEGWVAGLRRLAAVTALAATTCAVGNVEGSPPSRSRLPLWLPQPVASASLVDGEGTAATMVLPCRWRRAGSEAPGCRWLLRCVVPPPAGGRARWTTCSLSVSIDGGITHAAAQPRVVLEGVSSLQSVAPHTLPAEGGTLAIVCRPPVAAAALVPRSSAQERWRRGRGRTCSTALPDDAIPLRATSAAEGQFTVPAAPTGDYRFLLSPNGSHFTPPPPESELTEVRVAPSPRASLLRPLRALAGGVASVVVRASGAVPTGQLEVLVIAPGGRTAARATAEVSRAGRDAVVVVAKLSLPVSAAPVTLHLRGEAGVQVPVEGQLHLVPCPRFTSGRVLAVHVGGEEMVLPLEPDCVERCAAAIRDGVYRFLLANAGRRWPLAVVRVGKTGGAVTFRTPALPEACAQAREQLRVDVALALNPGAVVTCLRPRIVPYETPSRVLLSPPEGPRAGGTRVRCRFTPPIPARARVHAVFRVQGRTASDAVPLSVGSRGEALLDTPPLWREAVIASGGEDAVHAPVVATLVLQAGGADMCPAPTGSDSHPRPGTAPFTFLPPWTVRGARVEEGGRAAVLWGVGLSAARDPRVRALPRRAPDQPAMGGPGEAGPPAGVRPSWRGYEVPCTVDPASQCARCELPQVFQSGCLLSLSLSLNSGADWSDAPRPASLVYPPVVGAVRPALTSLRGGVTLRLQVAHAPPGEQRVWARVTGARGITHTVEGRVLDGGAGLGLTRRKEQEQGEEEEGRGWVDGESSGSGTERVFPQEGPPPVGPWRTVELLLPNVAALGVVHSGPVEGELELCWASRGDPQWGTAATSRVPHTFYPLSPVVRDVRPRAGALWGGEVLRVTGRHYFDTPGLRVRLVARGSGRSVTVRATFVSSTELRCPCPSLPEPGPYTLQVSLNARDVGPCTEDADFVAWRHWQSRPRRAGPSQEEVALRGKRPPTALRGEVPERGRRGKDVASRARLSESGSEAGGGGEEESRAGPVGEEASAGDVDVGGWVGVTALSNDAITAALRMGTRFEDGDSDGGRVSGDSERGSHVPEGKKEEEEEEVNFGHLSPRRLRAYATAKAAALAGEAVLASGGRCETRGVPRDVVALTRLAMEAMGGEEEEGGAGAEAALAQLDHSSLQWVEGSGAADADGAARGDEGRERAAPPAGRAQTARGAGLGYEPLAEAQTRALHFVRRLRSLFADRQKQHLVRQHFRLMFVSMDTDGNWTLDAAEFARGIARLFPAVGEAEIQALWRHCDVDGDGEVTLEEFLGQLAPQESGPPVGPAAYTPSFALVEPRPPGPALRPPQAGRGGRGQSLRASRAALVASTREGAGETAPRPPGAGGRGRPRVGRRIREHRGSM